MDVRGPLPVWRRVLGANYICKWMRGRRLLPPLHWTSEAADCGTTQDSRHHQNRGNEQLVGAAWACSREIWASSTLDSVCMQRWYYNQYILWFHWLCFQDIEMNNIIGTDLHWIFIWDNLAAHHSRYVHNTLVNHVGPSNFSIVPRPPYHPKYGPIENKIWKVVEKIWLKKEENLNLNRIEQEIMIAANQISKFDSTLVYCGYR